MTPARKTIAWNACRIGLAAGILALLLTQVDLRSMAQTLAQTDLRYVAGAVGLATLNRLLMAIKWRVFLGLGGVDVSLIKASKMVFLSGFYGSMLPGGIGVDALRLGYLHRQKHALSTSASAILADRLIGLLTMVTASAIGVMFCLPLLPDTRLAVALGLTAGVAWVVTMLLVSGVAFRLLKLALGRSASTQATLRRAQRVHTALRAMFRSPAALAQVLAIALTVLASRVLLVYLLFLALGLSVPLSVQFAFVPVITVLTLLPISVFFGLGIKDGAFVYAYGLVGMAMAGAFSASLLTYAVQLIVMIGGGLLFTFLGPPVTRPTTDAPETLPPSLTPKAVSP